MLGSHYHSDFQIWATCQSASLVFTLGTVVNWLNIGFCTTPRAVLMAQRDGAN